MRQTAKASAFHPGGAASMGSGCSSGPAGESASPPGTWLCPTALGTLSYFASVHASVSQTRQRAFWEGMYLALTLGQTGRQKIEL